MKALLPILICLMCQLGFGQRLAPEKIDQLASEHVLAGLNTLRDFLSIPNYGRNSDDIDRNLAWCAQAFRDLNFETEVLVSDGVKHLLAQRIFRSEGPTLLFYLQIDGQPVDASEWLQESPFIPVLKDCKNGDCLAISWDKLDANYDPEWKIFARSASDSKGPAVAFLQSLRILHEQDIQPDFNIKVIMDFQEELGSPTLPSLVEAQRECHQKHDDPLKPGSVDKVRHLR